MFVCAIGMWLMRYWAVLGFMALLALMLLFFAFALIKVSSVLGFAIAIVGVVRHRLSVLQARARAQPPPDAPVPRALTSGAEALLTTLQIGSAAWRIVL